MSSPLPYLVRMLLFLVAVAGLGYVLHQDLLRVFMNTPILNGVIVAVLLIGIFFVMRQVISLWPEVKWLRRFHHREEGAPPLETHTIDLLVPLGTMLGERQDRLRLSPTVTRAVLDGIASRLDERRELTRYLIGLLIFLGLLGTFWGLLETIGAVADAIGKLQVSGGDATAMFARLRESIEGPLKGMATAFGASLFGLSGSLVLGFLELQASQAQGRFHIELEEWLAGATRLSSGAVADGEQGVSAYVEALLERTADGLDDLTRTLRRAEEGREATVAASATLVERLAALAEAMRGQQTLLARMGEQSIELRSAINRLSERSASETDREALANHQRSIEGHLARIVEESTRSRAALAEEMRVLAGRLADRASPDEREAVLAHQRNIEAHLARLVDENVRGRTALADELRGEFRLLARTVASASRGAVHPPGES
ncbi:MAG: flagellar motor protein MotA [Reyranella sp.]|nr:flagellar motor protein MotA [Reyranella sp.]MBL6653371.1 flagellar motor protein MotA [Reyranella sp.]